MKHNENKSERLIKLEQILRSHPEGLRRAEIARRLGVHRATVGRYIDQLSQRIPLWEENYKIKLNEKKGTSLFQPAFYEAVVLFLSLRLILQTVEVDNPHVVSVARKIALAVAPAFPFLSNQITKMAEEAEGESVASPDVRHFEILADAWLTAVPVLVEFQKGPGNPVCRMPLHVRMMELKSDFSLGKGVRVLTWCKRYKSDCSFFLKNVKAVSFTEEENNFSNSISVACPYGRYSPRNARVKERQEEQRFPLKILLVEDDELVREPFRYELEDAGHIIKTSVSGQEAIELLGQESFDLLITDLYLPGKSGFEVVEFAQNSCPNIGTIMITGYGEKEVVIKALRAGVDDFIEKPLGMLDLKKSVVRVRRKQLEDLDKKSLFVREVYHRVKNHLAVITTLIELQYDVIDNGEYLDFLSQLKGKIQAIHLLHDRLSVSSPRDSIDIGQYTEELLDRLAQLYEHNALKSPKLLITKSLVHKKVPVKVFLPYGLVLVELFTNTQKHARRDPTEISVNLRESASNLILTYMDNGIGFREDFKLEQSSSTGLSLLLNLVRQMDGSISLKQPSPPVFKVIFPHQTC